HAAETRQLRHEGGKGDCEMSKAFLIGVLCVLCASVASVDAFAAGQPCDRACLRTALDSYLNALIKHDAAAAALMIGFRQTENAIVVRPPNGLWKTMTALGPVQR